MPERCQYDNTGFCLVHLADHRREGYVDPEADAAESQQCRCKARPYTTCTNQATHKDGLCDPCRQSGGDGHPKARSR